MTVRVQTEDFDLSAEVAALRAARPNVGAVASFVGVVRDMNAGDAVSGMFLEHYPGMTEAALSDIIVRAHAKFDFIDAIIVHRVGQLQPLDQIVLVAVASPHRGEAFDACHFIMDFLKTDAPFWKREATPDGERWVDARASDDAATSKWQ